MVVVVIVAVMVVVFEGAELVPVVVVIVATPTPLAVVAVIVADVVVVGSLSPRWTSAFCLYYYFAFCLLFKTSLLMKMQCLVALCAPVCAQGPVLLACLFFGFLFIPFVSLI